jgi:hypothetical protein
LVEGRDRRVLHNQMDGLLEYRNTVLTEGIESLPDHEQRLIVEVFSNNVTM